MSTISDKSVVGLLDGTIFKVSTQKSGTKILFNSDCGNMFNGKTNLTSIDFGNNVVDSSSMTSMAQMFMNCGNLTEIKNINNLDVSNVETMWQLFTSCGKLTSLDLSNWRTNKLTNMLGVFFNDSILKEVKFGPGWNTSKVIDMRSVFNSCWNLQTLDLSNFDTSSVTMMHSMFNANNSLNKITLGPKFKFVSNTETPINYLLPAQTFSGADGKWYNEATGIGYAPEDIPSGVAATYMSKKPRLEKGSILKIGGNQYIVLEERENNQALVTTASSIENINFQIDLEGDAYLRPDGQNRNTYEGSTVDNYLENEWYNGLSSKMKSAIQITNIKQVSYKQFDDPNSKQETGYGGQVYNTLSRHVFLPSVEEIGKAVDLKNPDKVKAFLKGTHIWTRDSYKGLQNNAEYLSASEGCLHRKFVNNLSGTCPTFVIDLSKVDYTVTGTVNYK